jgi:hypothetical protein
MKMVHPNLNVLRVDGSDDEAVKVGMFLLHSIALWTERGMVDRACERIKSMALTDPDLVIRSAAHGAARLHQSLGLQIEEP